MLRRIFSIVLVILISTYFANSQKQKLNFIQLSLDDGLSNNSVSCTYRDRQGLMWIGTVDGLNCFNGYEFTVYKHNPNDTNSISDNYISAIIEDLEGNIWIGTQGGGLNRFDPVKGVFTAFMHDPENSNSLASNYIFHHNSMLIDKDTVLWLGTDRGLTSFDLNSKKFSNFKFKYPEYNGKEINEIRAITEDNNHTLWIGTNNGIIHFDKLAGVKKILQKNSDNKKGLSNNIITSLLFNSQKNVLWIGTEDGLNVYDVDNETFTHYHHNKTDSTTISDNSITSLEKGKDGIIWIGTKSGGLNVFNENNNCFYSWTHTLYNKFSLSDNYVDDIFYDNGGFLWVGTVNNGISLTSLNGFTFNTLQNDPVNKNSLSNNIIRSIFKDKEGILWVGTYGGGLNRYDGKQFTQFFHLPENPLSLSHNIVSSIFEDSFGTLWIGTWGGGVNIFDKKNSQFKKVNSIPLNYVNDIVEDRNQNIWFGGNGGIYVYNPKTKIIQRIDSDTEPKKKLTATSAIKTIFDQKGDAWIATFEGLNKIVFKNPETIDFDSIIRYTKNDLLDRNITDSRILTLFEDHHKNIWIGTYTGGLSVIYDDNDLKARFKTFTEKDGLAGNIIYGILDDKFGNLWISSNNGLSRFNPEEETFLNFSTDDGLQSNQFYWNAYFKDPSGEIYFGGLKGLNSFFPENIQVSNSFPQVNITGFFLFNRKVMPASKEFKRTILEKSILYTDHITLKRNEYPFSFEFASLLFKSQKKIKYAYMLENFDKDWLYTDANKRYATYSHLRPGKYIFKVKSTNEFGVWNEECKTIKITILPAIWETKWAYVLYLIVVMGLLYLYRMQVLSKALLKHEINIQKLEKEKSKEYNELKLSFFTNISHEFRTPLTLITGPLKQLLMSEGLSGSFKEQLELINSGTKRLLKLINQLLEFRKVETGNFELKVGYQNIVSLIEEIGSLFQSKADELMIAYKLVIPKNEIKVWFDEYILETIVYNLLSNAFKFTPRGGEITFELELLNKQEQCINEDDEMKIHFIQIKVNDNGPGVSTDKMDLIFMPFYQVDQSLQGTGIGLSLCKDLAKLHKGELTLTDGLKTGTEFIVKIPVQKSYFSRDEMKPESYIKHEHERYMLDNLVLKEVKMPDFKNPENKKAPTILIIEDDPELVIYIGRILESEYRISFALNGTEGLKIAIEQVPDLIISDVMMPDISGIEICEKLKTDLRLSHIPIIILTALSSTDDRISGISAGADDFISKPFDQRHLLVRIEKLIEQRKNLQKHFLKDVTVFSDKGFSTIDEQFLKKVNSFIEKNIIETELSVENLGKEVGFSSTHLNRKLKSLTGITTNEYIRKIRLKKAASMLGSKQGNIAEVMYAVGFNNSSYFAKCFQNEFGITPRDFLNQL